MQWIESTLMKKNLKSWILHGSKLVGILRIMMKEPLTFAGTPYSILNSLPMLWLAIYEILRLE